LRLFASGVEGGPRLVGALLVDLEEVIDDAASEKAVRRKEGEKEREGRTSCGCCETKSTKRGENRLVRSTLK
jgi:hypothetical protein